MAHIARAQLTLAAPHSIHWWQLWHFRTTSPVLPHLFCCPVTASPFCCTSLASQTFLQGHFSRALLNIPVLLTVKTTRSTFATTKEKSSQHWHKHPNHLWIQLPYSHKTLRYDYLVISTDILTLHLAALEALCTLSTPYQTQHKPSTSLIQQQAAQRETGEIFVFDARVFSNINSLKGHLVQRRL